MCQYSETLNSNRHSKTLSFQTDFKCKLKCSSCTYCKWAATKEGASPVFVQYQRLKYVKDVSCVDQSTSVQPVTNVQTTVQDLPLGARLHQFWETWEAFVVGPKVIRILKEGYTLPFRT